MCNGVRSSASLAALGKSWVLALRIENITTELVATTQTHSHRPLEQWGDLEMANAEFKIGLSSNFFKHDIKRIIKLSLQATALPSAPTRRARGTGGRDPAPEGHGGSRHTPGRNGHKRRT